MDPCGALCLRQLRLPNHGIDNHPSRNKLALGSGNLKSKIENLKSKISKSKMDKPLRGALFTAAKAAES